MNWKIAISAAFVLAGFWACQMGTDTGEKVFSVTGDSSWTQLDRLSIILLGDSDNATDTLFDDSLRSLDELRSLSAKAYGGGKADFEITGYRDGRVVFKQTRHLGSDGKVVVDTGLDWKARPSALHVNPESLTLMAGSPAVEIAASVTPAYADGAVAWTVTGTGAVDLDFGGRPRTSPNVKVAPAGIGNVIVTARCLGDSTKTATVRITVVYAPASSLRIDGDSLKLYQGGSGAALSATLLPATADPAITWSTGNPAVAEVDDHGFVRPMQAGTTRIYASASTVSDSAVVTVMADAPGLTVSASPSTAPIHSTVAFTALASQEYGALVMFKWDLAGDGIWDDSATGPWMGRSVVLPVQSARYDQAGKRKALFLARDGEGNETPAQADFEITNEAPQVRAIPSDTTISIHDSVPLAAEFSDADGKISWWGWDYDGNGSYDDSSTVADTTIRIATGHRYALAGKYFAILMVRDGDGKFTRDTVQVTVVLDPPVVKAGGDTTVVVGRIIPIHAGGSDAYGLIEKWELKIGSAPYVRISSGDTSIAAPIMPGLLTLVVRVTDDDGLTGEDTVKVIVAYSSDNSLSNLTISAGTPDAEFDSTRLHYAARVGFADSMVSVTPTATDTTAQVSVNGKRVLRGSASNAVKVGIGGNANVFLIVVTAQDGKSQRVYDVSIERDPSAEAQLSGLRAPGLRLDTGFTAGVTNYSDTVSYKKTSVSFTPTTASSYATVTVNNTAAASGVAGGALPLQVGENTIKVVVTAQDGTTQTTYSIKVTRLAKLVLERLAGAQSTPVVFDSLELPLAEPGMVSAPSLTGYHFVNWSIGKGALKFSDSTQSGSMVAVLSDEGTARANFDTNTYSLAVASAGHGTVAPEGTQIVKHGIPTNISAAPATGYHFVNWSGSGLVAIANANAANTSVSETGNGSVTAQFSINHYSLSTNASSGSISKYPDQGLYDYGASVQLMAYPTTGYYFNGWGGSASGTVNPISITMDADKTVNADFQRITYTLSRQVVLPPGDEPSDLYSYSATTKVNGAYPNPVTVVYGGSYTLSADPYVTYTEYEFGTSQNDTSQPFACWKVTQGSGVSMSSPRSTSNVVTLTGGNATISAYYKTCPQ